MPEQSEPGGENRREEGREVRGGRPPQASRARGSLKDFLFSSERRSLLGVPVGEWHGQVYILQKSLWLQGREQTGVRAGEADQVGASASFIKCESPASRGKTVQTPHRR